MKHLALVFVGMAVCAGLGYADTLLVPSQYPTIQAGIDASIDGDTVLVSPGNYIENIDFQGKDITVMSTDGAEVTIIDGNQAGSVVTFESGESVNAILEGFTVTNGEGGGSFPNYTGGGITCTNSSSPTITNNTITRNSANSAGGGIACLDYSDPTITNNTITRNTAYNGGGIYGDDSFLTIMNNTITGNSAGHGGGIYGYYSGAIVTDNVISGNTASIWGGGMAVLEASHTPYPIWEICNNIIADNSGGSDGGGLSIQCSFPPPGHNITNNTITGNSADLGGGIALWWSAYPVITNTILWDNQAPEIYISPGGGNPTVSYSDIMGGWPGGGNIDEDPCFVYPDQKDYRLQWGSPCIDAGDPAFPLDPDGTIRDMGSFFYDQSMPVRILLTPYNMPIEIPAGGSSFDYAIQATNIDPVSQLVNIWCDATLPDGGIYGPVLGPVLVTLDSGVTISRERIQNVPAGAPEGMYSYNAYAFAAADTSTDSFTFVKLGADGSDALAGWFNSGESFVEEGDSQTAPTGLPETYSMGQNYPNPFNPVTNLSFSLPEAGEVTLVVFDIQGREVTRLIDGWRSAGVYEATFNGSDLASGIYFAHLTAGDLQQTRKILLVK